MFTAAELQDLPGVISAPRFATYLQARGNDVADALALYQWNLELSAAFMVPLQVCEIAARNGVAEAIEKVHGPDWPWSTGFVRSLPVPRTPTHYNPQIDLRAVAAREPTTGRVVAELKFAFWEKVFTVGQDARLWLPHFRTSFPGVPATTSVPVARAAAFAALQHVRHFRNRIAHHEPIFARNTAADYALIHEVIGWRSPTGAAWMNNIQRVTALIQVKP